MPKYDVVILTDSRYENPKELSPYVSNVLLEDGLMQSALEKRRLRVARKDWAAPGFDWSSTKSVLFRTTWDYFEKIDEFKSKLTEFEQSGITIINPVSLIRWNLNKRYLQDLSRAGIPVIDTLYLKRGEKRALGEILSSTGWHEVVLKPVIAAGAWNTFRIKAEEAAVFEAVFDSLTEREEMMLQPFQKNILEKGEVSLVVIGGEFTHSVLKKAKTGDYRVQDDYGGTIHSYAADENEIKLAEETVAACHPAPLFARVDVMWDNEDSLVVSEVELIEPELWFRNNEAAADKLAALLHKHYL